MAPPFCLLRRTRGPIAERRKAGSPSLASAVRPYADQCGDLCTPLAMDTIVRACGLSYLVLRHDDLENSSDAGQRNSNAERHLLVCAMDRIAGLLDSGLCQCRETRLARILSQTSSRRQKMGLSNRSGDSDIVCDLVTLSVVRLETGVQSLCTSNGELPVASRPRLSTLCCRIASY
jgi:hypothetical protein